MKIKTDNHFDSKRKHDALRKALEMYLFNYLPQTKKR